MSEYKNEVDFLKLIKSDEVVSGNFKVRQGSDVLMDLDLKNIKFRDCTISGGDFCSSIFNNCTFDNVLFKNLALVGVTFDNCDFIACKFSNIQLSFSMENCSVGGLIITHEFF